MIREFLLNFVPPFFYPFNRRLFLDDYGFFGDFRTWEKAVEESDGYDSAEIFRKVKRTALLAKSGKIAFERDSVSFKKPDYSWPLLAILLRIIYKKSGKLNLIDFGGSLGSTYYQHLDFIEEVFPVISWNIVEQKKFVKIGKKQFADGRLKFYENLVIATKKSGAKILLVSSVIGYIKDPFELIKEFKRLRFTDIIIDRTNFIDAKNHRITVQKPVPSIYKSTFPIRLFNIDKFIKLFLPEYEVQAIFPSYDGGSGKVGDTTYESKGIWFHLRSNKR